MSLIWNYKLLETILLSQINYKAIKKQIISCELINICKTFELKNSNKFGDNEAGGSAVA